MMKKNIEKIKKLLKSGDIENQTLAASLIFGLKLENEFIENTAFIKAASELFECPLEYLKRFGGVLVGSYSKNLEKKTSDIDIWLPILLSYSMAEGILLMANRIEIKLIEDRSTLSQTCFWSSGKLFWYKGKKIEIVANDFRPKTDGTKQIFGVELQKADLLSGLVHSTVYDSRDKNPKLPISSELEDRVRNANLGNKIYNLFAGYKEIIEFVSANFDPEYLEVEVEADTEATE